MVWLIVFATHGKVIITTNNRLRAGFARETDLRAWLACRRSPERRLTISID
jgi:hypothetical protein